MNEHTFSSKIIKKCREKGIAKAWKINDDFQGGVPDAWFLGTISDLWIEFKWLKELPKRDETKVLPALSALQLAWLKNLSKHDREAVCVIGLPKHALILSTVLEWENGATVRTLRTRLISHNDLVNWILFKCGE